jgi:ABC-2 type transport system ATP-binding protein
MDSVPRSAVELSVLTRRFKSLTAVDQLSFEVRPRSIFGLLGSNGAGKTTVIKMLTTLLPPSSGTASVAGFDIVREPDEVRRHIGYVSQMLSSDGVGREAIHFVIERVSGGDRARQGEN